MKQKDGDDAIMMVKVNFYQCMINRIKSHQNRMRNDRVLHVNMEFSSEINEPLS